MQREEALNYLRDILALESFISPSAISLEEISLGQDYNISIMIEHGDLQAIKAVAQKLGLETKEEDGKVIIFKP